MNKVSSALLTAALLTAPLMLASPALAMGEDCTTSTEQVTVLIREAAPAIDPVPPVYLVVTEYEFTHAQDGNGNGQGQGPVNKWVTDPDWNAETNPNSVGWVATGATRQVTTDTVLVPGKPGAPAQEAVYEVRDLPVTTCKPVLEPADPPLAPTPDPSDQPVYEPAPEAPAGPAAEPVAEPVVEAAVPVAAVAPPAPAVPVQPQDSGQLANTGAADWVLPAGLALLLGGAAAVGLARRTA